MSITIGGAPTSIEEVVRAARGREQVELAAPASQRLRDARALLERLARAGPAIYGLNSALGANAGQPLAPGDLDAYQRRAVRGRAVAVGAPYDRASVRAAQFARLAALARGGSGISLASFEAALALLNAGVFPVVPRHGSMGVTDMPLLAHMALPLFGEGQAEFEGQVLDGAQALARAGLSPVTLGAKDGLALFGSNAFSVGRASLALHDLRQLMDAWLCAVALSMEGFRANLSTLDERLQQARPAAGQVDVAARLRHLLRGSALWAANEARRLQDPLSMRVVPQVHGSLAWMAAQAIEQVEIELNAQADSPLVLAQDGAMLSNGNFHIPSIALALDSCAIALAQVASLALARCQRFMNPAMTGLPLQLTRHGPAHSGFGPVQKTLSALWTGIRQNANPASLDFLSVTEGAEDHANNALQGAEKLGEQIERARYVVAVELIVAAQAVDLRGTAVPSMGVGAQASYRTLRSLVPVLDEDRALGPDIERVSQAIAHGAFVAS
jgi:histidine ammonia-lyase